VGIDFTQGSTSTAGAGTPDYSARIAFRGDVDNSLRMSVPNGDDIVQVRASSTQGAWIDGRGAMFLAAEAACIASLGGAQATQFLVWEPGLTNSCNTVCAAKLCNGTASTCQQQGSETALGGAQYFNFNNECSQANPALARGAGAAMQAAQTGKLCCCRNADLNCQTSFLQ
jgi:hypothetical protein